MRRFGDGERFLRPDRPDPAAGPGGRHPFQLHRRLPRRDAGRRRGSCSEFLTEARLDAIGVFGYSAEDGTEAADLPGELPEDEVASRVADLADLADELMAQRAADRIGEVVDVLIDEDLGERPLPGPRRRTRRLRSTAPPRSACPVPGRTRRAALAVGDLVRVTVTGSDGVDLTGCPAAGAGAGGPAVRVLAAGPH